ncbi:peptide-N(4)-(N-acetyl-beta-glucosaminyl)asparagine amidase isoform X2 [Bacillus rossius redtenbacheri]|uniref:peptide-N(4)-(N-acetyl-beta- glucosaminyl)asparagine amidase isoform X2 n=1 Tax=Bacillus rossius redtenbacheri TaxID=93214 RepID=UPI002FDCBC97
MTSQTFDSLQTVEENPNPVYDKTTVVLLKIVENIIRDPQNPKFRTLRLDNAVVKDKLIPVIGAMECLFELGFEEGEECLSLPDAVPLDRLRKFHAALSARRAEHLRPPAAAPQSPVQQPHQAGLLAQMQRHAALVLQYEDPELQHRALSLVPLARLAGAAEERMAAVRRAVKAGRAPAGQEPDARDLLLLELLHWFKGSFFSWVDAPACDTCRGPTTSHEQVLEAGIRVEVYKCATCRDPTLFPRYNDPGKLLETRRGRCGEWANCFTLLCRTLGWDARFVLDLTDHVWTEVYSTGQGRWLHCDPCEDVCDQPLMYEAGWGKRLSYVLAFSRDDVQDVTWRYTSQWRDVMRRRTQCSEEELLQAVLSLRARRQAGLSPARRAFLQRRLVAELVEFLSPAAAPSPAELQGRTSGSLAWRLARREVQEAAAHTWVAGPEHLAALRLKVGYCTAGDRYEAGPRGDVPGWQSGAFSVQNVFRKVEHDWGFIYLARTEGSEEGRVQWRFDVSDSGLVVDTVAVHYSSFTKGSGQVQWQLSSGDVCLPLPADVGRTFTSDLRGCKTVTLSALLSGGEGSEAWQHAQILRQAKDSSECPLIVDIVLRQP